MPSLGYMQKVMSMKLFITSEIISDVLLTVTMYGKSTLPDPQPTANVPLSHPLSAHEFTPLQAQSK